MERFILKSWFNSQKGKIESTEPEISKRIAELLKAYTDKAWHKIVIAFLAIYGVYFMISGLCMTMFEVADAQLYSQLIIFIISIASYVIYKNNFPLSRLLKEISTYFIVYAGLNLFFPVLSFLGIEFTESSIYVYQLLLIGSFFIAYIEKAYLASFYLIILSFLPILTAFYTGFFYAMYGRIASSVLGYSSGFQTMRDAAYMDWSELFNLIITAAGATMLIIHLRPKSYSLKYTLLGWAYALSFTVIAISICPELIVPIIGMLAIYFDILGKILYPKEDYVTHMSRPFQSASFILIVVGTIVFSSLSPNSSDLDLTNIHVLGSIAVLLIALIGPLFYLNDKKEINFQNVSPLAYGFGALCVMVYMISGVNNQESVLILGRLALVAIGVVLVNNGSIDSRPFLVVFGLILLFLGLSLLISSANIIDFGAGMGTLGFLIFMAGSGLLIFSYNLIRVWEVDPNLTSKEGPQEIIDNKIIQAEEDDILDGEDKNSGIKESPKSQSQKDIIDLDVNEEDSSNITVDNEEKPDKPNSDETDLLD